MQAEGTKHYFRMKLVTSLIEELQRHSDGRPLLAGSTPSPPARGWSSWFALYSGTTWTDSEGCYGLRNSPLAQGETCPGLKERFRWTTFKQFRNYQENWKYNTDTSLLFMTSSFGGNCDRSKFVKLILSVPLTGRDWLSYGR